jgi:hypothetical protein
MAEFIRGISIITDFYQFIDCPLHSSLISFHGPSLLWFMGLWFLIRSPRAPAERRVKGLGDFAGVMPIIYDASVKGAFRKTDIK